MVQLWEIIEYATSAVNVSNASDIHLVYGMPPRMRRDGHLVSMPGVAPLGDEECIAYAIDLIGEEKYLQLLQAKGGEVDLSKSYNGTRVRGNVFFQQGHLSCAIRLLRDEIPEIESLGLPSIVSTFSTLKRGIVLVTGVTGSGKSTTLASILQRINDTRNDHIITLEDPIEYVYKPKKCVINQREIGKDTQDYMKALRAVLREDPDVVLIGEMRDNETIEIALTAAETGHLVFATVHTASAADTVDRIVEAFPSDKQKQVRMQLSQTLQAVLSQQLLPLKSGIGRVCACEVMIVDHAIRNLIREGKTPQIENAIATSAEKGGITMDNTLKFLALNGIIAPEVAIKSARNPAEFSSTFGNKLM